MNEGWDTKRVSRKQLQRCEISRSRGDEYGDEQLNFRFIT